jgi:hypothetical protein
MGRMGTFVAVVLVILVLGWFAGAVFGVWTNFRIGGL